MTYEHYEYEAPLLLGKVWANAVIYYHEEREEGRLITVVDNVIIDDINGKKVRINAEEDLRDRNFGRVIDEANATMWEAICA